MLEVQVINNFNLNFQKSSIKDNTNENMVNNFNNFIYFNNFENNQRK